MTRRAGLAVSTAIGFVLAAASIGAFAESHVRIVRLSSVEGQVQMDRATGQGLERAILNTPIVEGVRLVTGSDGLAEVEFENQSALRLADDSEVKFSHLSMNDAGNKVNQIEVVKGVVYLDAIAKGEDSFRITVANTSLLVQRDSLVRISAMAGPVQVAVFKGDVQLENQAQPVVVQKKETLTIDPANPAGYTVAKGTDTVQFDAWNKEREAYTNTYAQNAGYSGPNRAYGLQDLNYYGDYTYASGYGYVWQPFGFANALMGWDPYSNGAWAFYPGLGYSWASAYPWGWLPYHYGSWAFIKGTGWAWVPGNQYNGLWYATAFHSVPTVTQSPAGWTAATPPAVNAATNSGQQTVVVGKAGSSPASIPGGRIPPTFGSVIPGRTVAAVAQGASPKAASTPSNRTVFASANGGNAMGYHGSSAHVFAAPTHSVGFAEPVGFGSTYGGRGGLTAIGSSSTASAHNSSAAASAGSGGAHK
jgi:FecR protein